MKHVLPIISLVSILLCSCQTQQTVHPRRYQNMSQKASTTLCFDEHQYTMNCSVQIWRNQLITLSVQPILGIEMIRVEATLDSVLIVDKMNRRYTMIAYDWAEKAITPAPSFKLIQDFMTTPLSSKKKSTPLREFQVGTHAISIRSTFSQREYNQLTTPKRIELKKYKRVSLREILPL